MVRIRLVSGILLLLATALGQAQETPASVPKVDKSSLEKQLRYAEGFTPKVKIVLEDPVPSSVPAFYRVVAHLALEGQTFDRVYFLTADGRTLINGALWPMDASPFSEALAILPSNGASFGPAGAKVHIVVFSDFQCPYCRQLAKTIRDNIPKNYPNDVNVAFADFPLETIHPWARQMAEAAHCVGDMDAALFWQFHDWVFAHQGEITPLNVKDKAVAFATEHSRDPKQVGACIDSHATASEVQNNVQRGTTLQIQQTPVVYVNGRVLNGAIPWTTLDAVIKLELSSAPDKQARVAK